MKSFTCLMGITKKDGDVLSESLRKMKVGLILESGRARWFSMVSHFPGKQKGLWYFLSSTLFWGVQDKSNTVTNMMQKLAPENWKWLQKTLKGLLPDMGNRSKRGKCGPAPTRKSQWGASFSGQNPYPQIGSPVGNQALIVPRPLWDLLLLKLPHPELRQQMFTAYL